MTMNKLLKSVLKTVVYLLDQTESAADDVRDRVAQGYDRASDRVSDLRDQAHDIYAGEDHTLRNVLTFAAGVGVGVGAAMLFAPASGEEIRSQIGEKVQDIGGRVRDKFSSVSSEARRAATGTEGV
jgi:YtxH-like protein